MKKLSEPSDIQGKPEVQLVCACGASTESDVLGFLFVARTQRTQIKDSGCFFSIPLKWRKKTETNPDRQDVRH